MDTPKPSAEAAALERMPHIQQRLCLMWGSAELGSFIDRLILDSRDGKRQGFPVDITQELLFLAETNQIVRALAFVHSLKIPYRDALRKVEEMDQERQQSGNPYDNPLSSRDMAVRDRRQVPQAAPERQERRSGRDRRGAASGDDGVGVLLGKLIFKLATSKLTIFLIVAALVAKLLWPYLFKPAG